MSRLIDADTLKEEILSWARVITNPKMLGTEDTMYIIDSAPTVDAVSVIRCCNCKYYGAFSVNSKPTGKGWCDNCEKSVAEGWYCADGERKA